VSDRETLANELRQMIEHIRAHVPDAVINTRLAQSDQHGVVMHAQIMGGSGPSGSAHASAPVSECAPEMAENRALARAMIAMGLPPVQDAIPAKETTPAPKLHPVNGQEQPGRVVQFPAHEPERPEPKPDQAEPDPEPEDISWTAFWTWAKANGFANRDALEAAIGQSINQLTPAQIRKLAQSAIDAR
jgi:cell pole-organizing protein PopZ